MRRHEANLTGLLAGVLFLSIGTYALAVGPDRLGDALRWVWPITLLGLGIALLVGPSGRQHRTRDEVGAEGSEDREVEQTGGGHDGGVGTFL
jgi:cytochrome c-type biogenesis protein CcmH/NrfF